MQIDITFFSAPVEGTDLVLRVNFAGSVTPGDSGQSNAVVGYIDLDVDQNAATGTESNVDVSRDRSGNIAGTHRHRAKRGFHHQLSGSG